MNFEDFRETMLIILKDRDNEDETENLIQREYTLFKRANLNNNTDQRNFTRTVIDWAKERFKESELDVRGLKIMDTNELCVHLLSKWTELLAKPIEITPAEQRSYIRDLFSKFSKKM